MCTTVKSPTPKDPVKKDPIYLRNSILDGLGINAESRGRNSLRIDLGTPVPTPRAPIVPDDPSPGVGGPPGGRSLGISRPGASSSRELGIATRRVL